MVRLQAKSRKREHLGFVKRILCCGSDVFLYRLSGCVLVAKSIFVLRLEFDVRIFHHVDTGLRTLRSRTTAHH